MFKKITHDNDAQKMKPLEPYILGIKYSSSIPIEGQAGEQIPEGMGKGDHDGHSPSFSMPEFANGRDLRSGRQ